MGRLSIRGVFMATSTEINAVRDRCKYELAGHGHLSVQKSLISMVNACDPHWNKDHYGSGEHIRRFEDRVAQLLGKPAAIFMPSGTMAQQIALRIWSDRTGNRSIGMHPSCHLHVHEENACKELHQLDPVLIGDVRQPISFKDIQDIDKEMSAVVIELPQRHNGGLLTPWHELEETRHWADATSTKLHLDGARLWETESWYRKSVAETSALFDSVYVSFYKGIGGIGGAALAGSAELITEARIWLRRHGGNLIHLFPYVVAAEHGLETRLPKMPLYFKKAQEIAKTVSSCSEIFLTNAELHTNMMHLHFSQSPEKVVAAALKASERTGIWLLGSLWTSTGFARPIFELYVGDAALEVEQTEIERYFRLFDQLIKASKD